MKYQDYHRDDYFVISRDLSLKVAQVIREIPGSRTSRDLSWGHQRFRQFLLSEHAFVHQQEALKSCSFLYKKILC